METCAACPIPAVEESNLPATATYGQQFACRRLPRPPPIRSTMKKRGNTWRRRAFPSRFRKRNFTAPGRNCGRSLRLASVPARQQGAAADALCIGNILSANSYPLPPPPSTAGRLPWLAPRVERTRKCRRIEITAATRNGEVNEGIKYNGTK